MMTITKPLPLPPGSLADLLRVWQGRRLTRAPAQQGTSAMALLRDAARASESVTLAQAELLVEREVLLLLGDINGKIG